MKTLLLLFALALAAAAAKHPVPVKPHPMTKREWKIAQKAFAEYLRAHGGKVDPDSRVDGRPDEWGW